MEHTISMYAPGAGIESFSANIPTIVRETIGVKLRNEAWGALRLALEEALQSVPPHTKAIPHYKQQLQLYEKNCHDLFNRDRPALHRAIDDIVDELEQEVQQELEGANLLQRPEATSLQSIPVMRPTGAGEYDPSQPKAPVADMNSPDLGMRSPRRSVTPPEMPPPTAFEPPETSFVSRASEAASVTEAGSPVATIPSASGTKRPAAIAGIHLPNEPSKRPKTTERVIKKSIRLGLTKKDEYIFTQKGYEGRYVYRCNLSKCKERLGKNTIHFTNSKKAWTHFVGEGHSISNKDKVFQRWAHLVIEPKDKNMANNSKGKQPLPPVVQAPLSPKSPLMTLTSNSKGKQPEDTNRYMFATFRSHETEGFEQSAAEGNAPREVIDLDADTDLFVASDDDMPPSEPVSAVKLNARGQARKSYRDLPLGPYEFIE